MIFKTLSVLTFVSILSVSSQGAVVMNDSKMLDILISKKGMTRLSVVGDSIQDVVFPPLSGEIPLSDMVDLQTSGHVFLHSKDFFKSPFQLTILTKRGRVQDLMIIPVSRPPEPVLLKPSLSVREQEKLQMIQKQNYETKMQAVLSGVIPQELRRIRLSSSSLQTWGNLKGMPISSYEDKNAFYDVYYLENTSSNPLTLSASHFLFGNIEAVIFEHAVLAPEGKTSLVFLRSKSTRKLFPQLLERT
jgi:hypothetical protein